ncbi:BadF/BadG/BcrA/BcrD ATPase family protein [Mariniluteicoccus flavus]
MTDPTADNAPLAGLHDSPRVVLAADVGKTRCRVAVCRVGADGSEVLAQSTVAGVPGLATAPDTTLDHLEQALAALDPRALQQATAIGVGAAGARLAPGAATRLATALGIAHGRPVIVASDVLVAHLGALGGAPGTVTIAGTGAVAYHVASDGTLTMADGWGPVLGDLGGGFWFGAAGLQAALAADDGRGPATRLTERARTWAPDGSLQRLPSVIAGEGFSRHVADFARAVLEEAEAGDRVALAVRETGVRHLVTTTAAVADAALPVAVVGGLADNPGLAAALTSGLAERGLSTRTPLGTGLTGAALLGAYAASHGPRLPHEPHLHRPSCA